jgi:SAM-dependent methyltransferase
MSYVPKDYWLEHGKNYKINFKYTDSFKLQEKILLGYLQRITPFSTVLEVGCGFGRITKLILSNFSEIREYIATDLSPHQINEAEKYVNDLRSLRPLRFIVSDIQSLDLKNKYDLVLASEVLMHVLPSDIESVIGKLVDMSSTHVIDIDWYEEKLPRNVAPHNFIHQYEKIYRQFRQVKEVIRIPITKKGLVFKHDTKQSIFHAIIKF